MTAPERVAKNVRTIARHRGLTMKALSEAMEYKNVQVLYTRLSGGSRMSVDELERLAEVLEVSTETLLRDPSDLLTPKTGWMLDTADDDVRDNVMVAA